MTTVFEVDTIFRIVNRASPTITAILRQIRELNAAVDKAKANLATLASGGAGGAASLTTAINETKALAVEWRNVATNAGQARLAIGSASMAAVRGGGAGAAGGGRATLGSRLGIGGRALATGGGGIHFGGPGVGAPGGGHMSIGGPTGAAIATFGWGIDQAAKTQDYVWRLEDISGEPHDESTHAKFRKLLQDFQIKAGYSIDEAGKAALANIRLFQGTPGGGIDTLDEILSAGAVEARRKNASLEESVEAGIGLAHQFRAYTPDAIRNLMRTFAGLSTADPRSLTSMKRASGYAVPTLAQIGVDESSVLLAGTALAGAGVDSTKSGTWIREAVTRAMPGIVLGHSASNKKHEESLRKFGLVDESGKPTWFTDNKPDMFKLFAKTSDALQGMTPQDRAAYGRAAFGAQGFGAISVLGDPAVNQRMRQIDSLTKSQAYLDRYKNFGKDYSAGSTVQGFREAMATFNVTVGEIARGSLPVVNRELGDFKSILDGIRSIVPHAPSGGDAGTPDLLGVAATKTLGALSTAKDWMTKGAGVAAGFIEQQGALNREKQKADDERTHAMFDAIRAAGARQQRFAPGGQTQAPAPIHLNLNIDGRALAQAVSEQQTHSSEYPTTAPASDGSEFYGP